MRFKRLNIGGFGRLPAGLELEFGPGLNLVLAPNESGKTTMSDLISGLFYGFGKRKAGVHPYEPWDGGETGAELVYELDRGEVWSLGRYLKARGEETRWRDAAGKELDSKKLPPGETHLGLSRGVFGTVSSIKLDDLAEAFAGETPKEKRETQSSLLGFFFQEAATKGQVANPVELLQTWRDQAAALYSKDRRRGPGDKALREALAAAREELAQARALEAEAAASQAELKQVQAGLADLAARRRQAGQELELAQREAARAQLAARRQKLAAEISQLVAMGSVDQNSAQRARDLENRIKSAERAAQKGQAEAAQAGRKAEELRAGRELARWAEELAEAQRKLTALELRQADLEAKAAELTQAEKALQADWGPNPAKLAELSNDLPLELDRRGRELQQARSAANQAQDELHAQTPPAPTLSNLWMPGLVTLLAGLGLAGFSLISFQWDVWLITGIALAVLGAAASAAGRQARSRLAALQDLEQDAAQALTRLREAEERLNSLCAVSGLSPGTDPGALGQGINRAKSWRKGDLELQEARRELEREMRTLAELLKAQPGGALSGLEEALADQQRSLASAREAAGQVQALKDRAQAGQRETQAAREDLQRLVAEAGLKDLEEFRQAAERFRQVKELGVVQAELDQQLAEYPESGQALLPQQAEQKRDQARQALAALERESAALEQTRGRLQEALERLMDQPGAAQVEARLAELKEKRRGLIRRHDALLLGGELLDQAMAQYTLEAQPSLLKRAGDYLELMTRGAYTWLGSDLFQAKSGQPPQLNARPGRGTAERQAEVLSRGTRDQLYLCLRLALADEITAGGESLPLILDDPLVNFDDERMGAALRLLAELARTRQVILLTCHGEQAEMLGELPHARLTLQPA